MKEFTTKKAIDAELRLLNDPYYTREQPMLASLVAELQAAGDAEAWYELHRRLLGLYWARQQARETSAKQLSHVGERIRAAARQTPKPDISALQAELDAAKRDAAVHTALAFQVRAVADGLAWKALQYDRAALAVLGRGTRVDRLADDGVGLQTELAEIDALWVSERAFTIHNDLATILRHGDLTTVYPAEHRVSIREVKAGKPAAPSSPQMVRLTAAKNLINHGEVVDPSTGRTLGLERLPVLMQTRLPELAGLIAQARVDGFASRTFDGVHHVDVIDYRVWAGREHLLDIRDAQARDALGWTEERDRPLRWLTTTRRFRDRKNTFGYLAPLAVYPLSADDIADLMLGFLEIRSTVSGRGLEEAFAERGIAMTLPADKDAISREFLDAQRGDHVLGVPPDLREQLLNELLSIDSVISLVDAMFDVIEADPTATERFYTVAGIEGTGWGSPPTDTHPPD